jgi:hypothetical protein
MQLNKFKNLLPRVLLAVGVVIVASPIFLGMFYFRERLADSLEREIAQTTQRSAASFQHAFEQSLSVIELQISAIAGDSDMYLASRSVLFANNGQFLMEGLQKRNPLVSYLVLLDEGGNALLETGTRDAPIKCVVEGWRIDGTVANFCAPLRGYQERSAFIVGSVLISKLFENVRGGVLYGLNAKLIALETENHEEKVGSISENSGANYLQRPLKILPGMALSFTQDASIQSISVDDEMLWLGFWIALSGGSLFVLMSWLFRLERRRSQLEHERVSKELQALRARLNPHFLFNALNSIVNSIEVDPKMAAEMVAVLSGLYRKVTNATSRESHDLRDEMEIVALYLGIEKFRFGDRLNWTTAIPEQFLSTSVPTLAVHILVENAIKHGIAKNCDGGAVRIIVDSAKLGWVRIRVINTGVHATSRLTLGTGLGTLQNILRLLHGKSSVISLSDNENRETVVEFSVPGVSAK